MALTIPVLRISARRLKKSEESVDRHNVTDEHRASDEPGAKKEFSIVRKGYDPAEVETCLAEYDDAFRDLEEYSTRLKRELNEARLEISRLEAAEQDSIDNAMLAVFAAKDRIIQGAMDKAREIEERAVSSAGLPESLRPEQVPESDSAVSPPPDEEDRPTGSQLLAELGELVGNDENETTEPDDVLKAMLQEAESIRNRLDSGLAAAFDQMEQMQRDAEARAEELLKSARVEAEHLRAAGKSGVQTSIEVSLTEKGERPSRYSRNSAGLPRIGEGEGGSVLSKMNSLRERMREDDDDKPTVAPTHDAAG